VTIAPGDSGGACTRNPARMRQTGLAAGSAAFVERAPDGPPRAGLAGDSGAARAANRAAGACFGTLAQFYRGGLPAVHRCDDPPAGPPRVAYRRGRRPARGRGQRTATAGSTIAGHHDGHGGTEQVLAYRAAIIPGLNLAPVAEAAEGRAACTATATKWAAQIYRPGVGPWTLADIVIDNNDLRHPHPALPRPCRRAHTE